MWGFRIEQQQQQSVGHFILPININIVYIFDIFSYIVSFLLIKEEEEEEYKELLVGIRCRWGRLTSIIPKKNKRRRVQSVATAAAWLPTQLIPKLPGLRISTQRIIHRI